MSIPKTCKAQVFESANNLVYKDVEVPEPQEGQILVKSVACGVCFSDAAVGGGHMGNVFPRIPGHELVGDVVAVGPRESKWKVGDRVGGAWHGGHDGTCKQCQRGGFQFCENEAINGVSKDGGWSQYCILRSEAAVRISKDLDPVETAPLLCAGITTFNAVRKMQLSPGSTVAVQGLGGLGHLGLQYTRKMGYKVVALSSSGAKKDFATKLGAHHYLDASKEDHAEGLQKLGGADLIVVTAPNPQIIGNLINGLAPQGKLLILAPVGEVSINVVPLILKGNSVHGWPSGHALDSEEAIEFAGVHDVKCMVETFPLEKAKEAMEHMASGKVRFRAVLTF